MYDTILVPTDGVETARLAVEHAVELASTYEATLHALYVVDRAESGSAIVGTGVGSRDDEREADGERATRAVADAGEEAGVTVDRHVEDGTPHRVIVNYVAEYDVDMVVMSSRGRSGLLRLLQGSVTERVARDTGCPVLVVDRLGE